MTMLPPGFPLDTYTRAINAVSHILMAAIIAVTLWLHLLLAAIAGFLAYVLTRKLEARLCRHHTLSQRAKATVVTHMSVTAAFILAALGIRIGCLVEHGHGLEGMLIRIANMLDNPRESLPAAVVNYIPQSVMELRMQLVQMIKEHGHQMSTLGVDGLRADALVLVGLILGTMVAWLETPDSEYHKSLVAALVSRLDRLTDALKTVVLAQVEISAPNTVLMAIYLLDVLPLLGQHVSYSKSLILLTFVAGLILVVGNLISNAAIVVMSVTASLGLAVASLIFLVMVHKLEYLVNAHIISSRVDAWVQELILALIVMEALFGMSGVTATSVLYTYIKRELADAGLISQHVSR